MKELTFLVVLTLMLMVELKLNRLNETVDAILIAAESCAERRDG